MKTFATLIALVTLTFAAAAQESATPLTDAILARDPAVINKLTADPRTRFSPLGLAAWGGRADMVRQLLAEGADVNAQSGQRSTPLWNAIYGGDMECVRLLVEAGADFDNPLNWQHPVLDAISYMRTDILRYLLTKQAAPVKGALQAAARHPNAEICGILLAAGYNPNETDDAGRAPLSMAAGFPGGDAEIVRLLLAAGADVHQTFPVNGRTPLHEAARYHGEDNAEILRLLLEAGADMEARDKEGNTPLMLAVRYRNYPAAKYLLEHGADMTVTDEYGTTLLMKAVLGGSLPITGLLLDAGADVNAVNKHGRTALMLAAKQADDRADITGLLISRGADLEMKDEEGKTALIYAVEANDHDFGPLIVLLAAGADTEAATPDGRTVAEHISAWKRINAPALIESYRKKE